MYTLASHLRQHGFSVKCLWAWTQSSEEIWQMIMKTHVSPATKVVAISATVMRKSSRFFGISDQEFRDRCRAIKKHAPSCQIIVGGGQVQVADTSWLKQFSEVDYFISGQGESLLAYILDSLKKNIRPKLPDITRPYLVSDSSMPYENFSTSMTTWQDVDGILPGEPLPLELARGCIFRCSYCSYDLNGKKPEDFIKHKELIKQELLHNYHRFGTDTYYLADDLINESDYKVNMIYEIAQELPFQLHFSGYIRLDLVRRWPTAFKKLLDSGLYSAFFGIETVNDASGRAVGKGLGRARVSEGLEKIVNFCGDRFIGKAGMILGLPADDSDTCHHMLEWAQDLDVRKVIKSVSVQPLGINSRYGSSDIDKDPESFGYAIDQSSLSDSRRLNTDRWKTATYDSERAAADTKWIMDTLNTEYPWSSVANPWELPWVAWLDQENRDVLFENICDNKNPEVFSTWREYILHKDTQYHKKYLRLMHTYR